MSLSDAEANVASLKARLSAYEAQYNQLKASARLVPQVEAEFAQLNRDYDVQKKTYTDLLARREATTMGVDVQDTGGTQFRVIDPPRVAPQPVAPTRTMMLGLALLAALGAGLAASFVANELRPVFQDARDLRELAQRPIVGMVSMLSNEPPWRAGGAVLTCSREGWARCSPGLAPSSCSPHSRRACRVKARR